MSGLVALASETSASGAAWDTATLAQYGVLGVFAALLVLFAKTAYKRETDRADRLEAEVLRLNQLIQDKHIPALESATHALKEASEVVRDVQRERRQSGGVGG